MVTAKTKKSSPGGCSFMPKSGGLVNPSFILLHLFSVFLVHWFYGFGFWVLAGGFHVFMIHGLPKGKHPYEGSHEILKP